MNFNIEKELDKNRFSIVKYGWFFILITIGIVLLSIGLIKIEEESVLEMVLLYYFR